MGLKEYEKAQKAGMRTFRNQVSKGDYPYLPVLDDILVNTGTHTEVNVGLIDIPLQFVVGTRTAGRTNAFASDFMPLMEPSSEFGLKWRSLSDSHMEEGIHDPITVCEFMNRFYVIEGNKRVSVLKYFKSATVSANVTRVMPNEDDAEDLTVYREFLAFFRRTRLYDIRMTFPGNYMKLLSKITDDPEERLSKDQRSDLLYAFYRFQNIFLKKGGAELDITDGDCFLIYLDNFSIDNLIHRAEKVVTDQVEQLWSDFILKSKDDPISFLMQPSETPTASAPLLSKLFQNKGPEKLKIAFLYDKDPNISEWLYSHEISRHALELKFGDKIEIKTYIITDDEEGDKVVDQASADGFHVFFAATPNLFALTSRAALRHPRADFFNCSLNISNPHIHTYYGRMYEAKCLLGVLCGLLTDTDKIGYVGDYPINGTIANINAFARGLQLIRPNAKLYLEWPKITGVDVDERFREIGVSHVSGQELTAPGNLTKLFGVYDFKKSKIVAMPMWHWERFYEQIISSMLDGTYEKAGTEVKSLNYWWGISSGLIELVLSSSIAVQHKSLIEILQRDITEGEVDPFYGIIVDQEGKPHGAADRRFTRKAILEQNYLAENVIGEIPDFESLSGQSRVVVELLGNQN